MFIITESNVIFIESELGVIQAILITCFGYPLASNNPTDLSSQGGRLHLQLVLPVSEGDSKLEPR